MKPVGDFKIFNGFSCLAPGEKGKDIDDFIRSEAKRHTGCRFLTLSTFPPLIPFYEKNNFTVLGGKPAKPRPTKQLIMYLDLAHPSIHR